MIALRFCVIVRAAPGTPAYKTPEEYYDEVLELRKVISTLDKDSSLLRAKLRRVEEDNTKKEKEIESLMDPTKVLVISIQEFISSPVQI